MEALAFNPSSQEAEAGRPRSQGQPGLHTEIQANQGYETLSQNQMDEQTNQMGPIQFFKTTICCLYFKIISYQDLSIWLLFSAQKACPLELCSGLVTAEWQPPLYLERVFFKPFTSHPAYFTNYPPNPWRHSEVLAISEENTPAFTLQLRNGDTASKLGSHTPKPTPWWVCSREHCGLWRTLWRTSKRADRHLRNSSKPTQGAQEPAHGPQLAVKVKNLPS